MSDARGAANRDIKGKFIKGGNYSPETQFKKGKPSPRKGIGKPGWTNRTSFKPRESLWETNVREYQQIHAWVKRTLGQPNFCEICKSEKEKVYHWANKSRKYQRDISDWVRLCHKCHKKYDNRLIGVERIGELILQSHYDKKLILLMGNGGSLEAANHLSAELVGKFEIEKSPIAAVSLSSPVILTAISNDFGFEYSFSRQVEALGDKGGLVICFTTSDYDEPTKHNINLWNALETARRKKKMKVAVFGSDKTNRLLAYSNCTVRGEGLDTAEIQQDHLVLLHLVCRYIEKKMVGRKYNKRSNIV
jgi:D-sedoheptulose 7-phosphate isomerase